MDKEQIKKLSELARLKMEDAEMEKLAQEIGGILKYVEDVKKIKKSEGGAPVSPLLNVMREDNDPHESGVYTEKVLESAPQRSGQYIKVKKIL